MTGAFDGGDGFVAIYEGADPIINVYDGADLVADFAAGLEGDLDLSHSINTGLVAFVGSHPSGSPVLATERVGGGAVTTFGAADFTRVHPDIGTWRCFDNRSLTTAGAAFALTSQFQTLSTVWTIWADIVLDAVADWSRIFAAPWNATHVDPWTALDFTRSSNTTAARNASSDGTLRHASSAAGGFPTTAGRRRLWCTRNGTTWQFRRQRCPDREQRDRAVTGDLMVYNPAGDAVQSE